VPLGREGQAGSHWLLLDLGSVIVHVMSAPERDYYQLEMLWADASLLLHLQ
jgi:ribosome-associated protein